MAVCSWGSLYAMHLWSAMTFYDICQNTKKNIGTDVLILHVCKHVCNVTHNDGLTVSPLDYLAFLGMKRLRLLLLPLNGILATFRSEYDYDYDYDFFVLSTRTWENFDLLRA